MCPSRSSIKNRSAEPEKLVKPPRYVLAELESIDVVSTVSVVCSTVKFLTAATVATAEELSENLITPDSPV